MRNFLNILLFIFATSVFACAQANETSNCPVISVNGPSGVVEPNDSAIYTAEIDTKGQDSNLEYIWSISSGEIMTGQGTKILTVRQPDASLTVTVEINGLPQGCLNLASETSCGLRSPAAEKLDEFSGTFSQIGQIDFEYISKVVQNDPTAQLYVLNKYN